MLINKVKTEHFLKFMRPITFIFFAEKIVLVYYIKMPQQPELV
jgi:hypothetical protein